MTLATRYDVLMSNPMQYPPDRPPCIPPVNPPPGSQAFVPYLASAIANQAGLAFNNNPAKVYAFNLLSSNNWNNDHFRKALKFACEFFASEMIKYNGQVNPQDLVQQVATACVDIFAARCLLESPELQRVCGPDMTNIAIQKDGIYQQFVNEIGYYLGVGNKPPSQYPQPGQYPQPNHPPMGGGYQDYRSHNPVWDRVQMPQHRGYNSPPPMGYPTTPSPWTDIRPNYPSQFDQRGYHPGPPVMDRWQAPGLHPGTGFGRHQHPDPYRDQYRPSQPQDDDYVIHPGAVRRDYPIRGHQQPVRPTPTENTFMVKPPPVKPQLPEPTRDDWKPSNQQRWLVSFNKRKWKETFVRDPDNPTIVIQKLERLPMDRQQHTIHLSGQDLKLDVDARESETITALNKIMAATEADISISRSEEVPMEVCPYTVVSASQEEAFIAGRFKYEHYLNSGQTSKAFRCFADVSIPFPSIPGSKVMLDQLRAKKTFEEVAQYLKSAMFACDHTEETIRNKLSTKVFINAIDRHLTKIINDLLRYGLGLSTTIDSFVDDFCDLRSHIEKKYGDLLARGFDKFVTEHQTSWLPEMEEEDETGLSETIKEDTGTDKLSFLPTKISITYLDLFSGELGIDTSCDRGALILQGQSPVLFGVGRSLDQNKIALSKRAYADYVITKDNLIYRIHKGYLGNDAYIIREAYRDF